MLLDCNIILNTAKHSPLCVMRLVLEDDHDKQVSRIKVVVYAKEPSLLSGYVYECRVQARVCIPSLREFQKKPMVWFRIFILIFEFHYSR